MWAEEGHKTNKRKLREHALTRAQEGRYGAGRIQGNKGYGKVLGTI